MIDFNLVDANGSVSVRAFGSKSAATRYANANGLTVAANNGSLALIETVADDSADTDTPTADLDATDVDAVLDTLDGAEPTATETVSIRDVALSFDDAVVATMIADLGASFDRRDAFEAANGLPLGADNSYTRERKRMLGASVAVARFFLALGIEASDVVERKVASNAMFNAKALKKVTEMALYVAGIGQRMERVTRAFIACALIATDRGIETITNDTNRKFLCSAGFSGQITDQDLIDHLDDMRHRAMTSGAETQSSQARNVLDVLGLGTITTVHKSRDAIKLDASHPFFAKFRGDFLK